MPDPEESLINDQKRLMRELVKNLKTPLSTVSWASCYFKEYSYEEIADETDTSLLVPVKAQLFVSGTTLWNIGKNKNHL